MAIQFNRNLTRLVLVCVFGVAFYLFFSGYCFKQMRYLSDEEFIEIAVRNEFGRRKMKIDGSEASFRTFHAKHPNCCRVFRGNEKPPGWGLWRVNDVIVQVVYEVNQKTLQRAKEQYYEINYLVSPCGGIYGGDSYGMGREKN